MAPEHWEDALGHWYGVTHKSRAASLHCCILLPAVALVRAAGCPCVCSLGTASRVSGTTSRARCFPCMCPKAGWAIQMCYRLHRYLWEKGAANVPAAQPSLLSISVKPCFGKTLWNPSAWGNWIKVKPFYWHLLPQCFICHYGQMYSFALCLPLWECFALWWCWKWCLMTLAFTYWDSILGNLHAISMQTEGAGLYAQARKRNLQERVLWLLVTYGAF